MPTLAQRFEDYLVKTAEVSSVTLRNYRADLANFLTWTQTFLARRGVTVLNDSSLISQFSPFLIKEYVKSQTLENTPPATINRRLSALRAFGKFLTKTGILKDNPFGGVQNLANPKKSVVIPHLQGEPSVHLEGEIASNTVPIVSNQFSEVRLPKTDHRTLALALAGFSILLILTFTAGLYLGKSPSPKKTTVLGAFSVKVVKYPLPAPSVTFGDLIKRERGN